jgi:dTDP-glucose 4,6-dehydratase
VEGRKVPVYGTGANVRDWLYVLDHCRAIDFLLQHGSPGEVYNIGGGEERTNLEITQTILALLEKDASMIAYVEDRKGHDFRYALDFTKLKKLGWEPAFSFDTAMAATVRWYVENEWWWRPLKDGRR